MDSIDSVPIGIQNSLKSIQYHIRVASQENTGFIRETLLLFLGPKKGLHHIIVQ